MLCRTANELYWMARHIERAENTARLLDVTYRTSLLPYEVREPGMAWAEPWSVPLITSGLATAYYERNAQLTAENVLKYMILDAANPSSIFCCLRAARESARSRCVPSRMKWYASSRSIVPNVTPRNRCERILTQSRNSDTPAASTRL